MKVYFHASITLKKEYGAYYNRIYNKLLDMGYKVDATHILKHNSNTINERNNGEEKVQKEYKELLSRILWADIVVCETSFPSSIVTGHVLTRALERGKPVLGLALEGKSVALLSAINLERMILCEYNSEDLEEIVEFEMENMDTLTDQRFTMILPGDIASHLSIVAENGVSRSEYIRELIRQDRQKIGDSY